jgi:peptide/nickel transport system permease protein
MAVVTFFLIHLTPGDPAATILGSQATETELEKLRESMGLNDPILMQFFNWIVQVFQGNLGWSIFMDMPVMQAIAEHLGPTVSLSVFAEIIAIVFAIPLGIMAATRKGSVADQLFMGIALVGISVPSFLIGLFLILLISLQLGWLPSGGYEALSEGFWNHLKYLIMPAFTLGILQAALIARMTRSSMLEVLNENYIKTAESKGLKRRIVIYKHAMRNALVPILTVIGQSFATLIGGAVVTETVFNIPGIGQLIVNSVLRRDYEVIQGTLLLIASLYVLINLVIDLFYGYIDPRIRLNRK